MFYVFTHVGFHEASGTTIRNGGHAMAPFEVRYLLRYGHPENGRLAP
jgi:hypothetical protein